MQSKIAILRGLQYKIINNYDKRISRFYTSKQVYYGTYCDYYKYKKIKLVFNSTRTFYGKAKTGTKRNFSLARARERIFRIAEANTQENREYKPVFFTLTTTDQVKDYKQSNRKIKAFIRRFNDYLGYKVKYLIVPEKHKSGAIHYHGIFFNIPFVDVRYLRHQLWKFGYVDLSVPRKIKSVSKYLAKYLTKDFTESTPLHTKMYFTSRGLIYPQVDYDNEIPEHGTILSTALLPEVSIIKYNLCKK